MKKKLVKLTVCALIAAFCIAPVSGAGVLKAAAAETEASETQEPKATEKTKETKETEAPAASKKGNPLKGVQDRIAQAKKDNPNNKGIMGWLTVTGTNIHEPICFTPKNNSHYLYRDIKGTNYPQIVNFPNYKNYPATVTYLDYRTKLGETFTSKGASRNYVLYGHNWNNLSESNLVVGNKPGYTMFAQLPSYTNIKFAEDNPYIYFSTDTCEGVWKVFSVAYCEVSSKFPYHIPYNTKDKIAWLNKEWKERSIFDFSTDVNDDDRLLTLSTCTRQYAGVGESQRFVVVARLLREGESTKDKVTVEVNKDMKKPKF